jgi:hypothetical protein
LSVNNFAFSACYLRTKPDSHPGVWKPDSQSKNGV